jgi:hypothetical protein
VKYKSIFLANIAEIARPLTQLMMGASREHEIFEDHAFCDRFMFAQNDERILVTPLPIEAAFWEDTTARIGMKNWINLSPKVIQESVCQAVAEDEGLMRKLTEAIRESPDIEILAYSATDEFVELVKKLKHRGLVFRTPEMPIEGSEWTTNFFGSKSGFRQTVNSLRLADMPEGMVCHNTTEVLGLARYILDKHGGVVLKTNRGLAGAGLKIIKRADLKEKNLNDVINEILASEPFWTKELIAVEALVEADLTVAGGNPNVELKIEGDKVERLYFCGMRVTKQGEFRGVEIGEGTAPKEMQEILFKWGAEWGEYLKMTGYRGFFDMDCILGKDKRIWPLESNTRRTGGTHLYELGVRLFGKNFAQTHFVAGNNVTEAPKFYNKKYSDLKVAIEDLLYPMNGKKEGVLVTVTNYLVEGKLGYGVVGPNKTRVEEIEKKFLGKLA